MNHWMRALASAVLAAWAAGSATAGCAIDRVDVRGPGGQSRFTVELADDAAERARGLMYREALPRLSGMLFVFERPREVSFWMRNTLIPLDMIFADAAGVVQRVHAEALPRDETLIPSGPGIFAVLEINGGLAADLGIAPGSELRHPAFAGGGQAPAWPCE